MIDRLTKTFFLLLKDINISTNSVKISDNEMRNISSAPKPARFSRSVSTLSLNQKITLLEKFL